MKFIPIDVWLFVWIVSAGGNTSMQLDGPMTMPACEKAVAAILARMHDERSARSVVALCLPPKE